MNARIVVVAAFVMLAQGSIFSGCNSGSSRGASGAVVLGSGPTDAYSLDSELASDASSDFFAEASAALTAKLARSYDPAAETRLDVAYKGHGATAFSDSYWDAWKQPAYAIDGDWKTHWRPYQGPEGIHLGVRFFRDQPTTFAALGVSLDRDDTRPLGPWAAVRLRVESGPAGGPFVEVATFDLPEGRQHHLLELDAPVTSQAVRVVVLACDHEHPLIAELKVFATPGGAPQVAAALPRSVEGAAAQVELARQPDVARLGGFVAEVRNEGAYSSNEKANRMLDYDTMSGWWAQSIDEQPAPAALIQLGSNRAVTVDRVYLRLVEEQDHRPLWIELIGSADPGATIDGCRTIAHVLVQSQGEHVFVDLPRTSLSRLGLVLRSGWHQSRGPKIQELAVLEAR